MRASEVDLGNQYIEFFGGELMGYVLYGRQNSSPYAYVSKRNTSTKYAISRVLVEKKNNSTKSAAKRKASKSIPDETEVQSKYKRCLADSGKYSNFGKKLY